jgi:hypothetical protein
MCSCEPGPDQTIGAFGDFSVSMAIGDILKAQDEIQSTSIRQNIQKFKK